MSYLASNGIFHELDNRCFIPNEMSEGLLDPDVRSLLEFHDTTMFGHGLAELTTCMLTGENPIQKAMGVSFFEYFSARPNEQAKYQSQVAVLTTFEKDVPKCYDFSYCSGVVDVAGGRGGLLKAIMESNPKIQGTLFEQASNQSNILPELVRFESRFKFVPGSFFATVDCIGDVFILAMALHCFNDEATVKILSNVQAAMIRSATVGKLSTVKLLLVEGDYDVVKPNVMHGARSMDLMLSLMEGRERTSEDWSRLGGAAGLKLTKKILMPPSFFAIIEFEVSSNIPEC